MASTLAASRQRGRIVRIARKAYAGVRLLVLRYRVALADVRIHRARLEAELYRNRYRLRTKNDDDLPIMP